MPDRIDQDQLDAILSEVREKELLSDLSMADTLDVELDGVIDAKIEGDTLVVTFGK